MWIIAHFIIKGGMHRYRCSIGIGTSIGTSIGTDTRVESSSADSTTPIVVYVWTIWIKSLFFNFNDNWQYSLLTESITTTWTLVELRRKRVKFKHILFLYSSKYKNHI